MANGVILFLVGCWCNELQLVNNVSDGEIVDLRRIVCIFTTF